MIISGHFQLTTGGQIDANTHRSKRAGAGGVGGLRREIARLRALRLKRESQSAGGGLIHIPCRRGSGGLANKGYILAESVALRLPMLLTLLRGR